MMAAKKTDKKGELVKAGERMLARAASVKVTSQKTYDAAAVFCQEANDRIGDVEDFFGPLKAKAYETHKALTTEEKQRLTPLREARRIVDKARNDWYAEEKRKADEAARKAKEEEDRRQAERDRLEKERQRKEFEAEQEKARKLREAEEAREAGKKKEAAKLERQAEKIEPPEPEPEPEPPPRPPAPKVDAPKASEGTKVSMPWVAKVTSKTALIKAVADGKAPATLLTVDQKALNAYAKMTREEFDVPGAEAYQETRSAYGGR